MDGRRDGAHRDCVCPSRPCSGVECSAGDSRFARQHHVCGHAGGRVIVGHLHRPLWPPSWVADHHVDHGRRRRAECRSSRRRHLHLPRAACAGRARTLWHEPRLRALQRASAAAIARPASHVVRALLCSRLRRRGAPRMASAAQAGRLALGAAALDTATLVGSRPCETRARVAPLAHDTRQVSVRCRTLAARCDHQRAATSPWPCRGPRRGGLLLHGCTERAVRRGRRRS